MNNKDEGSEKAAQLRRDAEEIVHRKEFSSPEGMEALSQKKAMQTIHELLVHQIELKMQKEELLRAHAELDAARARYFALYNLAPVGYLIISREGLILEVNLAAVNLLDLARAVLVKKPITRFILKEDLDIYYQHRKQLWMTGKPDACELRMVKSDGTKFWARLTATVTQNTPMSSGQGAGDAPVSRVVLSDIGGQKRVEKKKSKFEAELRRGKKCLPAGRKTGRGKGAGKGAGK
jgi:PAS domain S-box-containing protein